MIYNRNMPRKAVYWSPPGNDGFGELDFSLVVPVVVSCRWQESIELSRDADGNEFTSSHVVYVDRSVSNKGYLLLDSQDISIGQDPKAVDAAREIRIVYTTTDLSGSETLVKAML